MVDRMEAASPATYNPPMVDPFAPKALRLKPLQVSGFSTAIELKDGHLTLGRSDDNDIVLPGEQFPSVSLHHALLEMTEEGLMVQDLGSRNGTLVNSKPIERAKLVAGDILQLTSIGPRFVVVSSSPLSETMFLDPKKMRGQTDAELTESRVVDIKEALGVPDHMGVEEFVARKTRRALFGIGLLSVIIVTALVLWGLELSAEGQKGQGRLLTMTQTLQSAGDQHRLELESARRDYEVELATLRSNRTQLETNIEALRTRQASLETEGTASSTQLAGLRMELDTERERLKEQLAQLALLDPLSVEQERLHQVARVNESVVLLEAALMIRDKETGKVLHLVDVHAGTGPNFNDEGEPLMLESTGSGFCVSSDGWILTNAHVVTSAEEDELIPIDEESPVEQFLRIEAVFSGDSTRHPVEVVQVAKSGVDLALVRIEPFDEMPFLEGFDTETPRPPAGSDVFLFGFPLGNFALQQGETVIASTFRGILSREVDNYLQVDAGVHPGNSGGPVTDAQGHVIGVVFSVQALPDQSAVYSIGYAIPISEAAQLWPPR